MNQKKKIYRELLELKGLMKKEKVTYEDLSRQMGISLHTISDKFNGFSAFNCEEVKKINEILNIERWEIPYYFF